MHGNRNQERVAKVSRLRWLHAQNRKPMIHSLRWWIFKEFLLSWFWGLIAPEHVWSPITQHKSQRVLTFMSDKNFLIGICIIVRVVITTLKPRPFSRKLFSCIYNNHRQSIISWLNLQKSRNEDACNRVALTAVTRNSFKPCCSCHSPKKSPVHLSKSGTFSRHCLDKDARTIASTYAVRNKSSLHLQLHISQLNASEWPLFEML